MTPWLAAVGLASIAATPHAQSFGPPTPGICFLSRERVLDQTKAGAIANARLAGFSQAIERELAGERAAIAADANVLQIQKPVIDEAIYQRRAGALALRAQAFDTLQATRADQIARTRAQVTARILGETARGLAAVIAERGCSAVLEASGAYAVNPRMDLTTEVIEGLDRRMPTIAFDLEPARSR
jgi:Skp family chaperone for outer membrane proteins